MKVVVSLAVFAVVAAVTYANEFPCPKKQRPAGKTDCSYYCQLKGQWKLGKYQDGVPCDYNAQNDGVCKGGLCYGPNSGPSQSNGGDQNQENEGTENEGTDDEWNDK